MDKDKNQYIPRSIDSMVDKHLGFAGALVIEGPKACGKTSTALQHAASNVRLDKDSQARKMGIENPEALLPGNTPRLIDEWQLVPEVWNSVRAEVDSRNLDGQFILTGSATPADDITRHSGAMRFNRLQMHTMTLSELGASTKSISLSQLWQTNTLASSTAYKGELQKTVELMCKGGWPTNIKRSVEASLDANSNYLRTMGSVDIITVDGIKRDPRKVEALFFALARNSATYVTNKTLLADTELYGQSIDAKTLTSYLDALTRLWLVKEQKSWGEHLRSKTQIRKSPKRHLCDASLAIAALGADVNSLLDDRETCGQVFESFVFHELQVYSEHIGANIFAFQTNSGEEMDAVVVKGVQWAGVEVKLTQDAEVIDVAAGNLVKIAAKMRSKPKFLCIITANGYSYTRADGVHVVCITDLTS
jgi:predicted AAA+ superfamily ATPase